MGVCFREGRLPHPERARAAEAPGALEPAGQMPNTVKGVVDNEVSKPLML